MEIEKHESHRNSNISSQNIKQSSLKCEQLGFFRDIQATTDMCSPDGNIISVMSL